jgi:hypothetical protein
MLLLAVVLPWLSLVLAAFDGPPWANSWQEFAKICASCFQNDDVLEKARKEYGGKPVLWEVTIPQNVKFEGDSVEVEVPAAEFTVGDAKTSVQKLNIRMREGSVEAWKKLPPGGKARIQGNLSRALGIFIFVNGKLKELSLWVDEGTPATP